MAKPKSKDSPPAIKAPAEKKYRCIVTSAVTGLGIGDVVSDELLAKNHPGLGDVDRLVRLGCVLRIVEVPPTPGSSGSGIVTSPLSIDEINNLAGVSDDEAAALADLIDDLGRDPTDDEIKSIDGFGPVTLEAYRAAQAAKGGAS